MRPCPHASRRKRTLRFPRQIRSTITRDHSSQPRPQGHKMRNSSNASFSPWLSSIACLGLISALVVAPLGCNSSATGGKDGASGSTAATGGSTADGAAGAGGGDAASEVSSEAPSDVLSDATDGGQTPAEVRGQYLT